jgi:hypothetical protein
MMLWRVLHAESLKMKRTMALKMVVLAPATVVLLALLMASQAPFTMLRRGGVSNEWMALERVHLMFWAFLMMPLFLTLESALVAGLDHSENQWKSLLARPVARWTFYVAKLLVVMAMIAAATLLLLGGVVMDGLALKRLQSQVTFSIPIPWLAMVRECAQVAGLAFLALTLQHWVSLRWRSFAAPVGVGIVALVIGFSAFAATQQVAAWPQYFPWSLPMLVLSRRPINIEAVLWVSWAVGLVVAAAGCVDFCRREVK